MRLVAGLLGRDRGGGNFATQGRLVAHELLATSRGERFVKLEAIDQPVLAVNKRQTIMLVMINFYLLAQHVPAVQLII
jgi:hypothetical protein